MIDDSRFLIFDWMGGAWRWKGAGFFGGAWWDGATKAVSCPAPYTHVGFRPLRSRHEKGKESELGPLATVHQTSVFVVARHLGCAAETGRWFSLAPRVLGFVARCDLSETVHHEGHEGSEDGMSGSIHVRGRVRFMLPQGTRRFPPVFLHVISA